MGGLQGKRCCQKDRIQVCGSRQGRPVTGGGKPRAGLPVPVWRVPGVHGRDRLRGGRRRVRAASAAGRRAGRRHRRPLGQRARGRPAAADARRGRRRAAGAPPGPRRHASCVSARLAAARHRRRSMPCSAPCLSATRFGRCWEGARLPARWVERLAAARLCRAVCVPHMPARRRRARGAAGGAGGGRDRGAGRRARRRRRVRVAVQPAGAAAGPGPALVAEAGGRVAARRPPGAGRAAGAQPVVNSYRV